MKRGKQRDTCVFYFFKDSEPTTKNRKNKIHKLVYNDFYIQNELTNQQKLIKLSNYSDYFYLCDNVSQLRLTEIHDDDMCINQENMYSDNTILLEFKDRNLIYLKDYLKNLSSSNKYILAIVQSYRQLLQGIHLLVESQICHNHIRFDSIVVANTDFLLSNFSVSIDYSRKNISEYIKHFVLAYEPDYIEWTIELHILSYVLTNKIHSLSEYNIESIISEYISHHTILNTFGHTVVSSYKQEGIEYFNKYVNQPYDYVVADILRYAHTWDNYALSILFLRILIGIHKSIKIHNKFIIYFMKLLVGNLHLNPLKRETVETTMRKFENLLEIIELKDYKQVIDLMSP